MGCIHFCCLVLLLSPTWVPPEVGSWGGHSNMLFAMKDAAEKPQNLMKGWRKID